MPGFKWHDIHEIFVLFLWVQTQMYPSPLHTHGIRARFLHILWKPFHLWVIAENVHQEISSQKEYTTHYASGERADIQ